MKRLLDIALSATGLLSLAPLMLLLALIIRATSKGPALHLSDRVGRGGRLFRMYKFRTMKTEAPAVATHLMARPEDYLTKVGPFLRRTSLDELPQLINILRGEMSFVGPRPALFNQHDLIGARSERGIHAIPPGLTGWAQINGRDELDVPLKVRYDEHYLNNRSFALDIKIILLTALKVIRREGVRH